MLTIRGQFYLMQKMFKCKQTYNMLLEYYFSIPGAS